MTLPGGPRLRDSPTKGLQGTRYSTTSWDRTSSYLSQGRRGEVDTDSVVPETDVELPRVLLVTRVHTHVSRPRSLSSDLVK